MWVELLKPLLHPLIGWEVAIFGDKEDVDVLVDGDNDDDLVTDCFDWITILNKIWFFWDESD